MLKKICDFFSTYKYIIILSILLSLSTSCLIYQLKNNYDLKNEMNNNIIALTDSIEYYTAKNGELVASKTILEGDLSTLRLANDSLYKVIKNMRLTDPTSIVYVDSKIVNPQIDTVFVISHDTIYNGFIQEFSFVNKYRALEGFMTYTDSLLSIDIARDEVYFDYVVVIEDSKVYIKSNNPYVKYNSITGLIHSNVSKRKKWSVGIGPSLGIGYNGDKISPYIGIGVNIQYNLLQW